MTPLHRSIGHPRDLIVKIASSGLTGPGSPIWRHHSSARLAARRDPAFGRIGRRSLPSTLETSLVPSAPLIAFSAWRARPSSGRALVPYRRAGSPAIDDACALRRLMAARAASVGGIGHADAPDGVREQNCHEKVPHVSSIVARPRGWRSACYQGIMGIRVAAGAYHIKMNTCDARSVCLPTPRDGAAHCHEGTRNEEPDDPVRSRVEVRLECSSGLLPWTIGTAIPARMGQH
jgi:hypothetical protein